MSNDADEPDDAGRRRLPLIHLRHRADEEQQEGEEGIAARLAHQWALRRDERQAQLELPVAVAPRAAFDGPQVPKGVDLAAAWSWRFLVIVAAAAVLFLAIGFLSVVVLPVVIALLITALVIPIVDGMVRLGLPRGLSALAVVIAGIGLVGLLLTLAGQQIANGANDLADQTVAGLDEIRTWLKDGPLNASDSQINDYIARAQDAITERSREGEIVGRISEVGSAVGHVFAGFFIVLFSTYFFLADGERIWAWLVRIAPRSARGRVDSSGRVAWISLTQFVRATVIVALVDAIGIAVGAAIIGVPFVLAIGVLVFLGAFVPLVGATVAGAVAVLVALVANGPITALVMLAIIIGVQQLEAHVLQPFLMGRWVSVHPLAVILAIATGVLVAGVAGALVAVPIAAALNAVVQHLAANTAPGDDPVEELDEDYEETGETVDVPEEARDE
ncbi:AI-2E family transporter [Nocardioides sp. YIM 152315]|uniref:AI-2E family transporter n=1 Tax=Nocardioides sp. YIM 152315 TaxID=3031760 RepID=UPI0023DA8959|nr:AI-2E family transporter [Nocardioides sp. YIM 152315]MDF1603328.1 AI-2E family transporter [Nocardioides sp. YIM 152315]